MRNEFCFKNDIEITNPTVYTKISFNFLVPRTNAYCIYGQIFECNQKMPNLSFHNEIKSALYTLIRYKN